MPSQPIKKLIDIFSDFPTIGKRTAQRFVFYLMKQPQDKINELILSIQELKSKISLCKFCFNPFEMNGEPADLCEICRNPMREKSLLCIVEKEEDLLSIEKTKKYKGYYFILGGTVATLKKNNIEELRTRELDQRLKSPQNFGVDAHFNEIIIATNPTPEGRTTAILVEKKIRETFADIQMKITHLGLGLPVGGELEYADEETLESAFNNRK